MESPILKRIAEFLQGQKKHKQWRVVFVIMAVIVGVGTVTALRMMGLAMTHKERVLHCQLQVHKHDESCYDSDKNLICGYADYVVHKHNDDCYNADLKLVCKLPEIEKHEHTKECYNKTVTLVCGQEETAGHEHTDQCYTTQKGGLECKEKEHSHSDDCYDEEGNLTCGLDEHQHDDNCYKWEEVLTCGMKEGEGGHTHSNECYIEQEGLTCGQLELHTHTDKCFEKIDKNGENVPENLKLVCDKIQLEEHIHTEAAGCLETVEVTPGETSEELETSDETDGTSEEGGEIFSTNLDEEGTEGEDGKAPEDGALEGEGGKAAEGEDGSEAGEDAGEEGEEGEAGVDEETADGEAADPDSYEESKTYEGLGYIVTASYNKDANIPEEAKLIAERITEESDSENYKKHEAEFKENMGDKEATLSALFKIGFYVEGEEVEPETPVLVTIQFVDKNGLPEGTPIKVVHFGEEGAEVIDGGKAESGSTSFKTNGFSVFGVGFNKEADAEEASVHIAESYEYEDAAFHITFHVEGDATPLDKSEKDKKEDIAGEEILTPVDEGEKSKEESKEDKKDEEPEEKKSEDSKTIEEETSEEASETAEEEVPKEKSEAEEDKSSDTSSEATEQETSEKKLEFKIEHFEKDSEEYKAVVEDAAETNDGSELLFVQAFSYAMYYDGVELDLSDCKVTAEVKAAKPLSTHIEESVPEAVGYLRAEGDVTEESGTGTADELQADEEKLPDEYQTEIELDIVEIKDKQVTGQIDSDVLNQKKTNTTMSFAAPQRMAARATGTPNPHFTVQYYAKLDKVAYNDNSLKKDITTKNTNELLVIDTTGKKLPQNGKGTTASPNGNSIRKLYVNTTTGKLETKSEWTKVYESREFEYYKAPSMNYINALVENSNYSLMKVWVLKEGKNADSTNENDWEIYDYNENLHFTNRESSATKDYIYIADDATLRLVYDTSKVGKEFGAAFYDYDIGDGLIYENEADAGSLRNGKTTSTQSKESGKTWYMHTKQSGINSVGNYGEKEGAKLAFGNCNTGSGLQYEMWSGNLLNKHNGTQEGHPTVSGSYRGCTFGLVKGLQNGNIQYADGVAAPNLFNDGEAAGKKAYNNYSLLFNQSGDTYTLSAVNGAQQSAGELDSFENPSPYSDKVHYHIWTNNFWPMDSAASFGTDGHDMKFGDYATKLNHKFVGQAGSGGTGAPAKGNFPESDDGVDHNSFFGMQYTVTFDLSADYVGPLEYYFFGDDDMWVFLGDEESNDGTLVCDIGGVHSSVGEYINLWDYIDKDAKGIHRHDETNCKLICTNKDKEHKHGKGCYSCGKTDHMKFTLNFYYTERGESGSTCWMQFTLPSVSSRTPQTTQKDYGHLQVDKDIVVKATDGTDKTVEEFFDAGTEQAQFFKEKEFTFTLTIPGLADDYAYVKYDATGNVIAGGGGVLEFEKIANGETFTLKDGEYIRIQYLPQGTSYTVTEGDTIITGVTYDSTDITKDDKTAQESKPKEDIKDSKNREVSGKIPISDVSEVVYTNRYTAYELPKTGGSGLIIYTIAGALCILFGAGFMYTKKARERRV